MLRVVGSANTDLASALEVIGKCDRRGAAGATARGAAAVGVGQATGWAQSVSFSAQAFAVVLAASVLFVGTGSSPAAAQSAPEESSGSVSPPEDATAARRAREHFVSGMEHFEAHRYRPAIHDFQLAAQLVPSADLWFNIARAHEELGEQEAAIEHYQKYLRDRVDPPDRARVEQRIAALQEQLAAARAAQSSRPTTGTLRLSANVEQVQILLDGTSIGRTPLAAPLTLEPGRHQLRLEREGYIPFRSEVRVEPGVVTAAYADLVPETRYRAIRGRRIATWIVAGLGIAGAAAATALWVKARGFAADEQFEDARAWGRYSDYTWGGVAILGVAAVILYFFEGRSVGTERIEPGAEP